ncbi:cytochrome b [Amorphus suaedae]
MAEAELHSERIWDPIVRITHWVVALAILLNGLIDDGGSVLHIWIGYIALAMLLLRVVWGFVGPAEARFSSFLPSASGARSHAADLAAGRVRSYRSHNPLGSLMVYALWSMLAVIIVTGIVMAGPPPLPPAEAPSQEQTLSQATTADSDGDRDDDDDGEGERGAKEESLVAEIHEIAANLILILAALHIGGVAVESYLSRTNLARQMVTGRRPARHDA